MKKIFVLIILTAAFGAMPVQELFVFAAEEGTGHYVPGSLADFGDMAPPSGLAFLDWYNHYSGSAGVSKTVPVAGFITANLNTKSNAEALGAMYTLPCSVLEGRYSAGLIAPYVFMNVTGTVTGPLGKTITRTDTTSGIGDITLIPFWLEWTNGDLRWGVQLDVYAPTGDYKAGQLANVGLNYWTFEPLVSFSYMGKKTGLEVTTTAGLDFNTNNNATDYQSGEVFHVDTTIAEHLPLFGCGVIGVGINGYYWKQYTGDSGSGARLGSFETLMTGVGPVISYISPKLCGGHTIVAELKWLPQMDTHYTLNGDYIWFKASFLF